MKEKRGRRWPNQSDIQEKKILTCLRGERHDLSIIEIKNKTKMGRNQVSNYLSRLVAKKKVVVRKTGRWNHFRIRNSFYHVT